MGASIETSDEQLRLVSNATRYVRWSSLYRTLFAGRNAGSAAVVMRGLALPVRQRRAAGGR